jgi:hypothetical protein
MLIDRSKILNNSLAIRTPVMPIVKSTIEQIKPDFDGVSDYKTNIVEWLKPIVDLSDFYVYPMNGVTEGLNWWYNRESRSVWMQPGDYQWIDNKDTDNTTIKYQSVPSAINGNMIKLLDGPLALDLAYVGSTAIKPIEIHNNVEFVFYSLSKSFGVRNIRTGWFFSRKEDKKLKALTYSAKYYNYYAHNVAETIISNFDIDFIHNTLNTYQSDICHKLDIIPSDSVWLANTTNPIYNKFKRGDINRVCIAEEVSAAYCSTTRSDHN